MRIKKVQLISFKRFDDLTIDLGEAPSRIIALIGPNGCGKSSVFDAFEQRQRNWVGANEVLEASFYFKSLFTPSFQLTPESYDANRSVRITFVPENFSASGSSFHLRSAYRYTSRLNVDTLKAQPNILTDSRRPGSSASLDRRLQHNYERLLGIAYAAFEAGNETGAQVRTEFMGKINNLLADILDVRVSSIGNVLSGKGQLYFEKDDSRDFPYENLSAGEKEVIDIIIDLVVRTNERTETIYCIDEPELHLNTAIRRRLLLAIESLIPENCQLWVATHSIGFLRALQEELAEKSSIFDFSATDLFRGAHTIRPMARSRSNWHRVFSTALDDIVGLLAPKTIVYCEGRKEPGSAGEEQGLDAIAYNEIFSESHPDTLFVSAGGTHELPRNNSVALQILRKAFEGVELLLLRDRDTASDAEREAFIAQTRHHRMLRRRELENYLFDASVLQSYCASKGVPFDAAAYNAIAADPLTTDFKAGDTTLRLKELCQANRLSHDEFKKQVSTHVKFCNSLFAELRDCIFAAANTNRVASS